MYLVEPTYRRHRNIVHGTDDGRFLLPWESEPSITKHELRSSGFLYVLFPLSSLFKNITIRSPGGVMFLATVYFYCPKYGGRYWFKGPNRTIDVQGDSGNTTITEEKVEGKAEETVEVIQVF